MVLEDDSAEQSPRIRIKDKNGDAAISGEGRAFLK
jgi:hypothetical protein